MGLIPATLQGTLAGLSSSPPTASPLVSTHPGSMASAVVFPTLSSVGPFSLASSFPPIPAKLVSKIKLLQFVELNDNITALEQNSSVARPHDQLPKQSEITSILTWVSAFSTYTAIIAEAYPARTKELLAYMRLMVREASRGNSKGWLAYDRIFRQNAAANPSLSWANMDPSLHSSLCLGTESPPLVCSLCNKLDHKAEDCALYKQPTAFSPTSVPPPKDTFTCPSGRSSRQKSTCPKICLSWNSGQCMLPGSCEFLHECFTCHEDHMAKDCSSHRQTLCLSVQSARNQQSHEAMVRVGTLLPLAELTGW